MTALNKTNFQRRERDKPAIVHLGIGAFFRSHLATFTALSSAWSIIGVSLRSTAMVEAFNRQDGLFTVVERGPGEAKAQVMDSVVHTLAASQNPWPVLEALASPTTKIVSLTVTEKGYCLNGLRTGLDEDDPDVIHDLSHPSTPKTAIGFIVEGLRLRHERGASGFTVLSCDNLPSNGSLARRAVLSFAAKTQPELLEWIESETSFPNSMVDRITPATTVQTLADVERLTGWVDACVVETEPFKQWVLEDDFVAGRPAWEEEGAIFTKDVQAFETAKLRMLNGTHSLIAYAGFLAGHKYVRDVMADPVLRAAVKRHFKAAASTLAPIEGFDPTLYAAQLEERFVNPAIAHETYQIAMDGTQKLPQRLIEPMAETTDQESFVFALAAWMRYCLGRTRSGQSYALRDPREKEIAELLGAKPEQQAPEVLVQKLMSLPGLFPQDMQTDEGLHQKLVRQFIELA